MKFNRLRILEAIALLPSTLFLAGGALFALVAGIIHAASSIKQNPEILLGYFFIAILYLIIFGIPALGFFFLWLLVLKELEWFLQKPALAWTICIVGMLSVVIAIVIFYKTLLLFGTYTEFATSLCLLMPLILGLRRLIILFVALLRVETSVE